MFACTLSVLSILLLTILFGQTVNAKHVNKWDILLHYTLCLTKQNTYTYTHIYMSPRISLGNISCKEQTVTKRTMTELQHINCCCFIEIHPNQPRKIEITVQIYLCRLLSPHGATAPSGPGPSHYPFFMITLRHTTVGRVPLEE